LSPDLVVATVSLVHDGSVEPEQAPSALRVAKWARRSRRRREQHPPDGRSGRTTAWPPASRSWPTGPVACYGEVAGAAGQLSGARLAAITPETSTPGCPARRLASARHTSVELGGSSPPVAMASATASRRRAAPCEAPDQSQPHLRAGREPPRSRHRRRAALDSAAAARHRPARFSTPPPRSSDTVAAQPDTIATQPGTIVAQP
jgi:hypothetical protein